jgi:hypothetical protein
MTTQQPTARAAGLTVYLVEPSSIRYYDDLGDYDQHDLAPDGDDRCTSCEVPVGIPLTGDEDTPTPVVTGVVYGPMENEPVALLCEDCLPVLVSVLAGSPVR